ncbi:MAG TPA: RelA/SpoT domain-containing protein [Paludibacter sp.]|nr:RelA/SpoT domain-containing protein [Paludibacter sp.]
MKVITDFLKQYNKEFEYYQKLSQIVAIEIEDQLIKHGIRAEITYRAKRPDKLKDKLIKRNIEKRYQTFDEIYNDIVDLAGVRVSLYFPSERVIIDEIIYELFHVEKKKIFPVESTRPKYTKRFSGYWATHYRIKLDKNIIDPKDYAPIVEIQVASVLMHAWSEVEHDLVYKPFYGELSVVELQILDEINGLVLSGEIALERLKSAISRRTKLASDINNQYNMTNFVLNAIDKNHLNKIKLCDTYLLNNYLNTIKKLGTREFESYIHKINVDSGETVSDQLLNIFLVDFYDTEKHNLRKYFKALNISDNIVLCSESYVKCWDILERAFNDFLANAQKQSDNHLSPELKTLVAKNIISEDEASRLTLLRRERERLSKGKETSTESYLKSFLRLLKGIKKKTVDKTSNTTIKKGLRNYRDYKDTTQQNFSNQHN